MISVIYSIQGEVGDAGLRGETGAQGRPVRGIEL